MRLSFAVLLFFLPALAVSEDKNFCDAVVSLDRPSLFKTSDFVALASSTAPMDKHAFVLYVERMTGAIHKRYEGSIADSMIYALKSGRALYATLVGGDEILNFIHGLPSSEHFTLGRSTAVLAARLVAVGLPLTYGGLAAGESYLSAFIAGGIVAATYIIRSYIWGLGYLVEKQALENIEHALATATQSSEPQEFWVVSSHEGRRHGIFFSRRLGDYTLDLVVWR